MSLPSVEAIVATRRQTGDIYKDSELLSDHGGFQRRIIRPYEPNTPGIKCFGRFGLYDMVKDHYYPTVAEYIEARSMYEKGNYPEQLLEIQVMNIPDAKRRQKPTLKIVFDASKQTPQAAEALQSNAA